MLTILFNPSPESHSGSVTGSVGIAGFSFATKTAFAEVAGTVGIGGSSLFAKTTLAGAITSRLGISGSAFGVALIPPKEWTPGAALDSEWVQGVVSESDWVKAAVSDSGWVKDSTSASGWTKAEAKDTTWLLEPPLT